jgi:hypothetical protein
MVIVVEDGTGKADANSYISADDVRAYALDRGITLPAISGSDDPIIAPMVLAMDFLESQHYTMFQANRPTQALQWPRKAYCSQPSSEWLMPTKIVSAQAQLVIEQVANNIQLFASKGGMNQSGAFITKRKVDVIETQYSERVIPGDPDMPAVYALLRDLIVGGNGLSVVRM